MAQNEFDMSQFPKTGQRLTISTHEDDIHNQENPAILIATKSTDESEYHVVVNPDDTEEYRDWVEQELSNDELGFTNPNLHRRIRENVLHDGKKVYTITEPFITGSPSIAYNTKYPIAKINFVYISGSSVRLVYHDIKDYWKDSAEIVGDNTFRFMSGYAPSSGLPMEVIYETTPLLDEEVTYRDYELFISGVHSYRTTKITLHTEEDEGDREHRVYENEIP